MVDPPHQLEVPQQQIHGGIPAPLTYPQGAAVHPVYPGIDGRQGVGNVESAVPVTVPIDLDPLTGPRNHPFDETHQVPHAVGSGVSHRIAQTDAPGSVLDGGGVELPWGFGWAPGGVL